MRLLVITVSTRDCTHCSQQCKAAVNQWKGHSVVWSKAGTQEGNDKRCKPSPQGRLVKTLTVVVNHDCFCLVCAALGYQLRSCHVRVVNLQ